MSTAEHMQSIEKAIQKAAIDGVLTEGAVKQFHELIAKNKSLTIDLDNALKKNEEGSEVLRLVQRERDDARTVRDELIKRQDELTERENKMLRLEIETECHKQRVTDHQDIIGLVFRNMETRRRVLGQEIVAIPGTPDEIDQYGNRQYGTGRQPDAVGVPITKDESETQA